MCSVVAQDKHLGKSYTVDLDDPTDMLMDSVAPDQTVWMHILIRSFNVNIRSTDKHMTSIECDVTDEIGSSDIGRQWM